MWEAGLDVHCEAVLRGGQGVLAAASPSAESCLSFSYGGSMRFWGQRLLAVHGCRKELIFAL